MSVKFSLQTRSVIRSRTSFGCVIYCNGMWTGACYDVITVGVFSASALKYKHGGLRRLRQQLNLQRHSLPMATENAALPLAAVASSMSPWSRLAAVTKMLARLDGLQSVAGEACDSLCTVAAAGDPLTLQAAATSLTEQVF